jgi:hypothetical protein
MAALIRTLTVTLILAGVVLLTFWRLSIDQRQQAIDELMTLNDQLQGQIEQREAMISRLSKSRRLAHVHVVDQRMVNGTTSETDILFIELDEHGSELARQAFTVPGDVLFIDAWTVKFDHDRVAEGHPLHGRSLVLLRRVYSDRIAPVDGLLIDMPGAIPPAYAVGELGRYEQLVWKSFWDIATNAGLAREMGIRVAQGEAVYKPVKAGQHYELIVDATGGMSLTPLDGEQTRVSKVDR